MKKRKLVTILSLALSLGLSTNVYAENLVITDPIQLERENQQQTFFPIKSFAFIGNELVNTEALVPALAPFMGEKQTVTDLVAARDVIRQECQKQGYMVYVAIPKEIGLDGVARFRIVELKLQAITVTGNNFFTEKQIRAALPELQEGETPNFKILSRQLFLANENPSRQIMLSFKASENGQGVDVETKVTDKKTTTTGITIDNTGTKESGESRMSMFYFDSSINDRGDLMAISYTTSPENVSKVTQTGLYYQIPLVKTGDKLTLTASYSNVDSGRIADVFNISGQGNNFGVRYSHPIKQTLLTKESIEYGYDYHRYINDVDWSGFQLGTNVDSQPLSIGYSYQHNSQAENFSYGLTYGHNLPGGSRNNSAIYNQSRSGAKANFDYWRMNANYQRTNKAGWMVNVVAEGQFSNDALISGEQIAFGGMNSVRGLGEREITGDKGLRLTAELYSPYIAPGQRLLVFLDQGWYSRNNALPGEVKADHMAGAGIGWRYFEKNQWTAKLDLAVAVKGNSITPSGNNKIHFSVTKFL